MWGLSGRQEGRKIPDFEWRGDVVLFETHGLRKVSKDGFYQESRKAGKLRVLNWDGRGGFLFGTHGLRKVSRGGIDQEGNEGEGGFQVLIKAAITIPRSARACDT